MKKEEIIIKTIKMKRRYVKNKKSKRKIKRFIKILLILGIILFIIFFADSKVRPVITSMAQNQARIMTTMAVNEAVTNELESQNIKYDDLVNIVRNSEDQIIAINVDSVKTNKIIAGVSTAVQNELSSYKNATFGIPLGNLTGMDFLTGYGPKINIHLKLSGSLETTIDSELNSAGINQTHHRIMMNINTTVYAMIPGYNTYTEVPSSFCIAETVIVGEVPSSYADMMRDDFNGPTIV